MFLYRGGLTAKFYPSRPGLLEAWLVLTSVKYHGNLYILIPLNQRLALTRLRATGPRWIVLSNVLTTGARPVLYSVGENKWWRKNNGSDRN